MVILLFLCIFQLNTDTAAQNRIFPRIRVLNEEDVRNKLPLNSKRSNKKVKRSNANKSTSEALSENEELHSLLFSDDSLDSSSHRQRCPSSNSACSEPVVIVGYTGDSSGYSSEARSSISDDVGSPGTVALDSPSEFGNDYPRDLSQEPGSVDLDSLDVGGASSPEMIYSPLHHQSRGMQVCTY